jgi:hypothetical protein
LLSKTIRVGFIFGKNWKPKYSCGDDLLRVISKDKNRSDVNGYIYGCKYRKLLFLLIFRFGQGFLPNVLDTAWSTDS